MHCWISDLGPHSTVKNQGLSAENIANYACMHNTLLMPIYGIAAWLWYVFITETYVPMPVQWYIN